jgi:hypothetical protein
MQSPTMLKKCRVKPFNLLIDGTIIITIVKSLLRGHLHLPTNFQKPMMRVCMANSLNDSSLSYQLRKHEFSRSILGCSIYKLKCNSFSYRELNKGGKKM